MSLSIRLLGISLAVAMFALFGSPLKALSSTLQRAMDWNHKNATSRMPVYFFSHGGVSTQADYRYFS